MNFFFNKQFTNFNYDKRLNMMYDNFKRLKNNGYRFKNYSKIYYNIKNDFKNVTLPQKTYKDKLTKAYIDEFGAGVNYMDSAVNYEKKYHSIRNLIQNI